MATPRQKKNDDWILLITHNNVTSKVRQIALVLPACMLKMMSTSLGVILVDVSWSVLKL